MTARQQWGLVAAIVGVLGLGLWITVRTLGHELFPVTIGSKAPDFEAKVVGAPATRTLEDYRGQVVLLNIWATWCVPCRTEMPSIQALHDTFAPNGLKVVAVSIDDAVPEDSVAAFAREYDLTFDILHDPQRRIDRAYQTTGYPETFVIGRDGVIRKKVIGAANWNSTGNRALIAQLLGMAAAPAAGADTTPHADSRGIPVTVVQP